LILRNRYVDWWQRRRKAEASGLSLAKETLSGKIQNLYESKQKPLPKSSNPLKGLNNLFISYEKQNTKEAYNSNGNLERV